MSLRFQDRVDRMSRLHNNRMAAFEKLHRRSDNYIAQLVSVAERWFKSLEWSRDLNVTQKYSILFVRLKF
jgi:hypothetical protein